MADNRPNILVIMTDQQRMDTVSAYGLNDLCRTPNIDRLADRGVLFTHAFTPTAICSPARASFYTGLYPHKNGGATHGYNSPFFAHFRAPIFIIFFGGRYSISIKFSSVI